MAWTTPKTWSNGGLVTETDLNQQIRDNMIHLKTTIDSNGKIAALNSTYLTDTDAVNVAGIVRTANDNDMSSGTHSFNSGNGRVVVPVGSNLWAT